MNTSNKTVFDAIKNNYKIKSNTAIQGKRCYNIHNELYMNQSIYLENMGMIFYPKLGICGYESPELNAVITLLSS